MTGRRRTIAFFITLTVCLTAAAVALNVSWIVIHWRRALPLIAGVILFALIIAGLIVNTTFLVREIRRNEQHDGFIDAVTHELKTPIASIRLYLETLLARDLTPEKRKEFYSVMLADSDRLHYTVEQVLKAGFHAQNRRQANVTEVDVATLARDAVELSRTRHHLSAHQIELIAPELPRDAMVLGDSDDLFTAMQNMLDNAVKYSGDRISVTLTVLADVETVRVEVRDRGVGIPPKDMDLIFERFYRAPTFAAKKVKGTGLGLFIVRSIAKKHGGRVYASSAGEGRGSAFTLEIPRIRT